MRRRNAGWIALGVLLGGLVVWWGMGRGAQVAPVGAPPAELVPDDPPVRPAPHAEVLAEVTAVPEPETSVRVPLHAAPRPAPEVEPLEVRVVHGPSSSPVAGARVVLGSRAEGRGEEIERLAEEFAALERILEVHGLVRITDAEGRARFPVPTAPSTLVARSGDLFGLRSLSAAEPGPVELVLEPDPPIFVRVEDERGRPLPGIAVGLRSEPHDQDSTRVRTDERGRAVLRAGAARGSFRSTQAYVGLAFPLREPIVSAVDLAAPPAEPIVLGMPPTGSVEVELVDESGWPWPRRARLGVSLSPRVLVEIGRHLIGANSFGCLVAEGRALLEPVGLGLELEIEVDTEGHAYTAKVVLGPRAAGERVAVRIELAQPWPLLAGRLVTGDGRALGPGRLQVLWRINGLPSSVGAEVDPEGRFACTVRYPEQLAGRTDARLEFLLRDRSSATWFGSLPMPALTRADLALGDVVLTELGAALAGTVRDEGGAPVPGARVELFLDPTDGLPFSGERVGFGLETDALGRFELREALAGERIGVRVSAEGFVASAPLVVPLGSADVEIVLPQGGWFRCRPLVDGHWGPTLAVEQAGKQLAVRMTSTGDGGYELGPFAPGLVTLRYGHPSSDLHGTVEGIVVRAGERTLDPRLDPLDLRHLVSTVALTVVDTEGRPVPALVVKLHRRRSDAFESCSQKRDGERLLVAGGPLPLRLRLEAPGFRALELADVDSDRRLVLERGRGLRLELDCALPVLTEGWSLEGRLQRIGEGSGTSSVPPLVFEGGVAETSFSLAGAHALEFQVVRRHAGVELERATFWDEPRPLLELEDGPGLLVVRAPAPSPALVAEILAFLETQE